MRFGKNYENFAEHLSMLCGDAIRISLDEKECSLEDLLLSVSQGDYTYADIKDYLSGESSDDINEAIGHVIRTRVLIPRLKKLGLI